MKVKATILPCSTNLRKSVMQTLMLQTLHGTVHLHSTMFSVKKKLRPTTRCHTLRLAELWKLMSHTTIRMQLPMSG